MVRALPLCCFSLDNGYVGTSIPYLSRLLCVPAPLENEVARSFWDVDLVHDAPLKVVFTASRGRYLPCGAAGAQVTPHPVDSLRGCRKLRASRAEWSLVFGIGVMCVRFVHGAVGLA